jgi:hypothetical protein
MFVIERRLRCTAPEWCINVDLMSTNGCSVDHMDKDSKRENCRRRRPFAHPGRRRAGAG